MRTSPRSYSDAGLNFLSSNGVQTRNSSCHLRIVIQIGSPSVSYQESTFGFGFDNQIAGSHCVSRACTVKYGNVLLSLNPFLLFVLEYSRVASAVQSVNFSIILAIDINFASKFRSDYILA